MIDNSYRTFTILYFALLGSVGMYGLIIFQITQNQAPKELEPTMFYALVGVAATMMVVIPVLRGKMLPPMREAHSLSVPKNSQAAMPSPSAAKNDVEERPAAQIVATIVTTITARENFNFAIAPARLPRFQDKNGPMAITRINGTSNGPIPRLK